MFTPNREELAWAAGFFDGEGNIRTQDRTRIRMTVTQIRREPLERFQKAVAGMGRIYGPYDRRQRGYENRKPIWHWHAASFEHAQAASAMLWPFLCGEKQRQIGVALRTFRRRTPHLVSCANAGHVIRSYVYGEKTQRHCLTCQREYNRTYDATRRHRT